MFSGHISHLPLILLELAPLMKSSHTRLDFLFTAAVKHGSGAHKWAVAILHTLIRSTLGVQPSVKELIEQLLNECVTCSCGMWAQCLTTLLIWIYRLFPCWNKSFLIPATFASYSFLSCPHFRAKFHKNPTVEFSFSSPSHLPPSFLPSIFPDNTLSQMPL